MAISLKKGERINLAKLAPSLSEPFIGIGWEFKEGINVEDYDLDVFSCLLTTDNHYVAKKTLCYYGNKKVLGGALQNSSDNLTGKGEGIDEWTRANKTKFPENTGKVLFGVNIFNGNSKRQYFSDLDEAFMVIKDNKSGKVLKEYDLDELIKGDNAIIIGELLYKEGNFEFVSILEKFRVNSIQEMLKQYGIKDPKKPLNNNQGGGFLKNLFG